MKIFKEILWILIIAITITAFHDTSTAQTKKDLDRAYQLLKSGNTLEAKSLFENYHKSYPNDTRVTLQLAYIHKALGNYNQAKDLFEEVERKSSSADELSKARTELSDVSTKLVSSSLETGYAYLRDGDYQSAIPIFERHISINPNDYTARLQLAYIYQSAGQIQKALESFEFVELYASNISEREKALVEIKNLQSKKSVSPEALNDAYAKLNSGDLRGAAEIFEAYQAANPQATNINLQLAYIYKQLGQSAKALEKFRYVETYSSNAEELKNARSEIAFLTLTRNILKKHSISMYFYNAYDTFQKNWLSNLLLHYNYQLFPAVVIGAYTDIYVDSRTTSENIYNDRYFEIGEFMRFTFVKGLNLEVRAGYVRQIDRKTGGFNFKPILTYQTRIGATDYFTEVTSASKVNFYLDLYTAVLYDHKYRNVFGQGRLMEAFQYPLGGYSAFELYLLQFIQGDTKQLDYNNYAEAGAGIAYTFNFLYSPRLFVEGTSKFYFYQERESSFQIRAGFLFNFNVGL